MKKTDCSNPIKFDFLIIGPTGSGKSTASRAVARNVIANPNLRDDDIFYSGCGYHHYSFRDYNNQPVILWEDFDGKDLYKRFCSKRISNKVNLSERIIIVNSILTKEQFCGPDYKDYQPKFILELGYNSYNLYTRNDDSSSVVYDKKEVSGSFSAIAENLGNSPEARILERKNLSPVLKYFE